MKKYNLTINNNAYSVVIQEVTDDHVTAEVNGAPVTVSIDSIENLGLLALEDADNAVHLSSPPPPTPVQPTSPPPAAASGGDGAITTPIPGQILSIHVNKGDTVTKGQKLLILEAMKLENIISATHDGTVKDILVKPNEVVNQGQALVIIG